MPFCRDTIHPARNVLLSDRIALHEVGEDEASEILRGHAPAGQNWADEYPLEGTLEAAGMLVRSGTAGVLHPGFGMYQIHDRASGLVVGDIGFHGSPNADGVIEIGYGIVPEFRGRGIASHALQLLSTWALKQPDVVAIAARTEVHHEASRRVLEMAGFQLIDVTDGVCRYRRHRPSSGSGTA